MSAPEEIKVWMEAQPAWDKRDPDPSKNYGVHGVELCFYMVGASGGVQFLLLTGWLLPETLGIHEPLQWKGASSHQYAELLHGKQAASMYPMPADLGYHSRRPLYEDQLHTEICPIIDGPCYYDGSGLNAEPIFETFLREGSAGVWLALAVYYESTFGVEVNVDA